MTTTVISHEEETNPSLRIGRAVHILSVALAFVPFLATGLLLVFAWHTSRSFGDWPSYANPDPKSANTVLYVGSGLAMLASIPSVVTLLIGLPIVRRLRLNRLDLLIMAAGLAGLAIFLTVFSGNLGDWYAD